MLLFPTGFSFYSIVRTNVEPQTTYEPNLASRAGHLRNEPLKGILINGVTIASGIRFSSTSRRPECRSVRDFMRDIAEAYALPDGVT
jgi:hypothetical protein